MGGYDFSIKTLAPDKSRGGERMAFPPRQREDFGSKDGGMNRCDVKFNG